MEITIDSIISVLGLIFGGSGIGWFITWRWQKAKAKAEAKQAEAEAKQKETGRQEQKERPFNFSRHSGR